MVAWLCSRDAQQDVPARKFHTNLLSFLQDFTVPKGQTQRNDPCIWNSFGDSGRGEVKPGVRRQFEQTLQPTPQGHIEIAAKACRLPYIL